MSDFLTHLAALALHTAPVVKPRLASYFESSPKGGRAVHDESSGSEVEPFQESADSSTTNATIAHSEPQGRTQAQRNDSDTSPLQTYPSPERGIANDLQRTSTPRERHAEINSLPTREQLVANELPSASSSVNSHIATTSPVVVETVIERSASLDRVPRDIGRESVESPSSGPSASVRPLTPGVIDRAAPRDNAARYGLGDPPGSPILDPSGLSRDDSENVTDRRSIRDTFGMEPRPFPVTPLRSEPASHEAAKTTPNGPLVAIPRLTTAPTPSQDSEGPAAATTIRVTIGRVEVRAILPPASAPPRATPARANSVLSLDEYLKRRTEGRT